MFSSTILEKQNISPKKKNQVFLESYNPFIFSRST